MIVLFQHHHLAPTSIILIMSGKASSFNLTLIATYKQHTMLYDNRHRDYKVQNPTKEAWLEVAKVCSSTRKYIVIIPNIVSYLTFNHFWFFLYGHLHHCLYRILHFQLSCILISVKLHFYSYRILLFTSSSLSSGWMSRPMESAERSLHKREEKEKCKSPL